MVIYGVVSALKISVELDPKKACDSIRDELFRCAGDVDGTFKNLFANVLHKNQRTKSVNQKHVSRKCLQIYRLR